MTSPEIPNPLILAGQKLTARGMLDHLIDILIHPNPNMQAWLRELIEPTNTSHGATERIAAFTTRAASANVAEAVALKMIIAAAKAEGWELSQDMLQKFVGFMYRAHREQLDEEHRVKQGSATS